MGRIILFVLVALVLAGCPAKEGPEFSVTAEPDINAPVGGGGTVTITTDFFRDTAEEVEMVIDWSSVDFIDVIEAEDVVAGSGTSDFFFQRSGPPTGYAFDPENTTHGADGDPSIQLLTITCVGVGTSIVTVEANWLASGTILRTEQDSFMVTCTDLPDCDNDGTREGTEQCDGTDLGGEDCVSRGFVGGTLACNSDCTFDTSGCDAAAMDYEILIAENEGRIFGFEADDSSVTEISLGITVDGFVNSIARGDSFMAVGGLWGSGNPGLAIYSEDGLAWTNVSPSATMTPSMFEDVAFGGGTYVAMSSTGAFFSTNDGSTWNASTTDISSTYATPTIAYGGGYFVSSNGYRSADGDTWTAMTTPPPEGESTIGYGGTRFVILGRATSNFAYYSDDGGDTWTDSGASLPGSWGYFTVAYGNSRYVAGGGNGQLIYSNDGETWTSCTADGWTTHVHGLAYQSTAGFLALGQNLVYQSDDGITFTDVGGDYSGMWFLSGVGVE